MEDWYKKLNYYQNPFSLNPFKDDSPWLGNKKILEDIIYYLKSGSIIYLEAEKGMGKTKTILELRKQFKGKLILINAAKLSKTLNIEEVLIKRNGLVGKVLRKKPIDQIVIIDNIEELSKVNYERIKYYYDQGFIQSILFTGTNFKKTNLPKSIISRIGKRVIKIPELSLEDAYELTAKRLREDITDEDSPIDKESVKKIYQASKKNYRLFLINLHRVFEEMIQEKDSKIEEKHINVLKDKLDEDDLEEFNLELEADFIPKNTSLKDEKGNKIIKIGDYYRNPNEDMFCSNCGAIVEESDIKCPECGSEFE